ncbi:alpha/beta fold hydrolase [Nocardia seriolae]|uniref:Triacylglycerol lipase n=1 Tax=Nocardia seriolae TaxID=37332 RepID=A0A0B8N8W9_9NOCA|nr:alpha/beta hydrolase [Nocardia seriolae]APA99623.1 Triacylglycerol lipase [Nocardia seriolae]MTJ64197.1 alpha/beta fold hydrolase [Nocardia seriolae]MTJ73166.1 alpha/beta fold hydrolase [Nocardia seriolae]MTJ89191.1 alpha/beta fold hydrolase [Nocardia seriolae]MTK33169.1 alpha/beta fold hydrolase [Nocardia seriolae]
MPEFDYHGVSVAYEHAGSGDPILFLHNIGGDRRIWADQTRALAATHSVYALDLFGYGDSDSPAGGYTVDNYVRMVSEFIAAHGLTDVTMVGNCFGSALSLLYARRESQNVRALVLCSPLTAATLRPTPTGWTARAAATMPLDSVVGAIRLPGVAANLVVREQLGPRGRGMGAAAFAGLRARWSEPRRLLPPAAIARDLPKLAALDDFRPGPGFPPVTTIWGAKNRILSAAAGARLNATLSPVRAIELPDCGHLVMLEEPETVTGAIRSATRTALAG